MSRELTEFSNLIDEQFEPDTTITDELWNLIQGWLVPQPAKEPHLNPLQRRGLENDFTRQAS